MADEWENLGDQPQQLIYIILTYRVEHPPADYRLSIGIQGFPPQSTAPELQLPFHQFTEEGLSIDLAGRTINLLEQYFIEADYAAERSRMLANFDFGDLIWIIRNLQIEKRITDRVEQPIAMIRWDHKARPRKQILQIDAEGIESTDSEVLEQLRALRILEHGFPVRGGRAGTGSLTGMTLEYLQSRYAEMADEYRRDGDKRPTMDDFAERLGSSGSRLYVHCQKNGFSARDISHPPLNGTLWDKNGGGHRE